MPICFEVTDASRVRIRNTEACVVHASVTRDDCASPLEVAANTRLCAMPCGVVARCLPVLPVVCDVWGNRFSAITAISLFTPPGAPLHVFAFDVRDDGTRVLGTVYVEASEFLAEGARLRIGPVELHVQRVEALESRSDTSGAWDQAVDDTGAANSVFVLPACLDVHSYETDTPLYAARALSLPGHLSPSAGGTAVVAAVPRGTSPEWEAYRDSLRAFAGTCVAVREHLRFCLRIDSRGTPAVVPFHVNLRLPGPCVHPEVFARLVRDCVAMSSSLHDVCTEHAGADGTLVLSALAVPHAGAEGTHRPPDKVYAVFLVGADKPPVMGPGCTEIGALPSTVEQKLVDELSRAYLALAAD